MCVKVSGICDNYDLRFEFHRLREAEGPLVFDLHLPPVQVRIEVVVKSEQK
jgi:hypothetical protein